MLELSRQQMQTMERLLEAGFLPIGIPPYENALCVKKGECAAVLTPTSGGGLKMLAPPSFLVDGRLSVRIKRDARDVFVWKDKELEATAEKMRELDAFRQELGELLKTPSSH